MPTEVTPRELEMSARAKLPQAEFREGDLEALPLASGSVDAAICTLAMVHLPEIGRAVAELARVVRTGVRVIISDVHPFLVLLGWQAQFHTTSGGTGFMRLHPICPRTIARPMRLLGCACAAATSRSLPPKPR
jgi:ubiquinone/menaquinone biosynthesis C-methylase UbiE